jgi:hypothetical protein
LKKTGKLVYFALSRLALCIFGSTVQCAASFVARRFAFAYYVFVFHVLPLLCIICSSVFFTVFMSVVIAVPNSPLTRALTENAERYCQECGIRLLRGTEHECRSWLGRHIADVALVTPLAFAIEAFTTDLQVVPVGALSLDSLTYAGSIYLRSGAMNKTDIRAVSPNAEDFLMQMGAIVFQEKFDVEFTLLQQIGSSQELIAHADIVIDYGFDAELDVALDISDEWGDYFGETLPMALWACRPEEAPDDLADILTAFQSEGSAIVQHIDEREQRGANAYRKGVIDARWSDEVEESLRALIELLYCRQMIPRIVDVKLWRQEARHTSA